MKKIALLALVGLSMTSCWVARIYTEVPTAKPVAPVQTVYTTQVTTPSPKVTTVSTFTVTNYNTDPCFYLDLNAVAAAFAESRSVKEFEQIINSSRYMINNLDLNHDGWIDYLRVIETYRGSYHTLLIQACLAPGMFQDVATLIAEHRPDALYVEVIGDRYLYGYNYIVRPVFVKRPPMWDVYGRSNYACWSSPYYYGSFPSYYTQPKPIYLNHYQAYVNTYMTNHHYCHHCDYPQQPHYNGYTEMTKPNRRNDYQVAYPDKSFERRVTSAASQSGVSVRNAGQLRTEVEKNSTRSTTTTTSQSSSTRSTTTTKPATSSTRQPSTSVNTRVNKSGTTRTTVKTTDETGRTTTVKRESSSGSTRSTSTSTRSTSTSSSSRSSQGTKTESSPRSGQRERSTTRQ
jgi:hypothetical protein